MWQAKVIRALSGSVVVLFMEGVSVCVCARLDVSTCVAFYCTRLLITSPFPFTGWIYGRRREAVKAPHRGAVAIHMPFMVTPVPFLHQTQSGLKMHEHKHQMALIKVCQLESKPNNLRTMYISVLHFLQRRHDKKLRELVFRGLYTAAEFNVNLKELNVLYCTGNRKEIDLVEPRLIVKHFSAAACVTYKRPKVKVKAQKVIQNQWQATSQVNKSTLS